MYFIFPQYFSISVYFKYYHHKMVPLFCGAKTYVSNPWVIVTFPFGCLGYICHIWLYCVLFLSSAVIVHTLKVAGHNGWMIVTSLMIVTILVTMTKLTRRNVFSVTTIVWVPCLLILRTTYSWYVMLWVMCNWYCHHLCHRVYSVCCSVHGPSSMYNGPNYSN